LQPAVHVRRGQRRLHDPAGEGRQQEADEEDQARADDVRNEGEELRLHLVQGLDDRAKTQGVQGRDRPISSTSQ
jgi:hypothetical protein